jgi:tetratricopeptide (TPR) repeat protein
MPATRGRWLRYSSTMDPKWTVLSEQNCRRASTLDPKLAAARVCLGTVANGTGKYQEAVTEFQKALDAEPTNNQAYEGLADTYDRMGRTAEAERTFQKAIQLRRQYWAGYSWLGMFYFRHGRYREARKMFEEVTKLVPDSYQGYYDLGAVYAQEGDFAQAVPLLEHSLRIRSNPTAYTNLGTAYFFLHRYDDAVRNFRRAVALLPADFEVRRNLADGYYWAPGKREEAGPAYRKAIDLADAALKVNPSSAQAYKIRAICQAMLGEKDAALKSLGKAQSLVKGDPDLSYTAALVYARLGDRERALKWLKLALAEGAAPSMARNDPLLDSLHGRKGFPGPERDSENGKRRQ